MTCRMGPLSRVVAGAVLAAALLVPAGCSEGPEVPSAAVVPSAPRTVARSVVPTQALTSRIGTAVPVPNGAAGGNGFVPPRRGVGAALDPDPDEAPIVPKGELKAYVTAFYDAVRAKDWRRASRMVPPAERGEGVADFQRRQTGFELGVANVLQAGMSGADGAATVVLITPEHGVWNVEWRFLRTRRGIVVQDLTYARPGGAG